MSAGSRHRPLPPFEIWQAGNRIVSVDNPVQLRLLERIEAAPATLNHLVSATRKSKPTLSALHLPPLLEAGVVAEAVDPKDARVKWYSLVGHRLGSSSVDPARLRDAVLGYVEQSGLVPLRPLLDVIRPSRLVEAARPAYVREVGARLGQLWRRMLLSRGPAERARELSALLAKEGLGEVQWINEELRVRASRRNLQPFVEELVANAMKL